MGTPHMDQYMLTVDVSLSRRRSIILPTAKHCAFTVASAFSFSAWNEKQAHKKDGVE